MNTQEEEWVSGFQGKAEAEILTAPLPEGISDEDAFRFRALQELAGAEARRSKEDAAEAARVSREQALLQQAARSLAVAQALQPEAEDTVAVPAQPQIPFAIPEGKTDALLEKQIASCAGIIEHLAHYIARYDSAVETCNQFMDRISVMMRSSAEAALAVGRLRGMAPEGRRRW